MGSAPPDAAAADLTENTRDKVSEDLYPPTVQNVPPDLTRPSAQYRRQVVIVLVCLALFIVFYFGLIFASAWLTKLALQFAIHLSAYSNEYSASSDDSRHNDSAYFFALAIPPAVLFIFLVKALFKWGRSTDKSRTEITEAEHPALFQFIRRICDDTHAPFPLRVFVTPEVNASVFYNSSLLSLILPVKKNLIIGLGLVNGLNLSEFKAVLAHEFGHFSQSSMRLGSYVYTANRVIYDLVYHRDKLDEVLAGARRVDLRIAFFAYIITFILWILRLLLQGAFRIINFFGSALSRQMEFHADLVAVSVTGSDALIHALKKLDFASACLTQTLNDLKEASEHGLYTSDLFYHQARAADHLRVRAEEPGLGLIPALPADPAHRVDVFTKEEDNGENDGMWASHPSHYDREQNAKRYYLRSPEDPRSPWLLFSEPERLRAAMTALCYEHLLELPPPATPAPPEQVQAFIDQEHEETRQDPRYSGMYDGRLLSIEADSLTGFANDPALAEMTEAETRSLLARQYDPGLKDWIEAHQTRRQDRSVLASIVEGKTRLKGKTFELRGAKHPRADAERMLAQVSRDVEADEEWLRQFDRTIFQVHLRMAQVTGTGDRELYERYYFHLHLQDLLVTARQEQVRMILLYQALAAKSDGLNKGEFAGVIGTLAEAHANIAEALHLHGSAPLPVLQNMHPGMPLGAALLDEPLLPPLPEPVKRIDRAWSTMLMKQVSQIEERARRLYFKSMGAILAKQETIAAAWLQAYPPQD